MAGKFSVKRNKELIIGAVTLGAVLLVLVGIAFGVSSCAELWNETTPSSTATESTESLPATLAANPYNPWDFSYKNGYLHCNAGRSELGVDVSSHQGDIDWKTVAGEGVSFAMVRLGYRGWGNGQVQADELAQANLQGAAAAGLKVGAYFYSQAITVEEAREEARFVLEALDGVKLSMPVVFDWEIFNENGRTAYVDSQTLNECTLVFCQMIAEAGYTPMVYFNLDIGSRLLDLPMLQQQGYGLWLAMYLGTEITTYPNRVDMWQYSETGYVKGIDGQVDLNLYFTYE